MSSHLNRYLKLMIGLLFLLPIGCATSHPTRYVEFKPLVEAKFSAGSKPAELSAESEGSLIEKGFAKIGNLTVEQVTKRCALYAQGQECKDIAQKSDPTADLLKEASGRGGQLVTLTSDKKPSAKSFSRRECVWWTLMPVYRYRYDYKTKGTTLQLVEERQCGLYQDIPVEDHIITSEGFVWRHEPELAKVQRFGREFINAAAGGDIKTLRNILTKGLDVNTRNMDGKLALGVAAGYGQMEAVKFLLEKGADLHATDKVGTPLHWAAGRGQVEMVRFLLSRGADINAKNRSVPDPWKGRTAFFNAATGGHVKVIEMFLQKGVHVDVKTDKGYTPLMEAAFYGKNEAVKALIKAGANVNAKTDEVLLGDSILYLTPFLMAVVSKDEETVLTLLLNGASAYTHINKDKTLTAAKIAERKELEIFYLLNRYSFGALGYRNTSGKIVIKPLFDEADNFSEGRAVVGSRTAARKLMGKGIFYGYIDRRGEFVYPIAFRKAYSFSKGLARVKNYYNKWGWLDRNGKFAIEPKFSDADDFSEGMAPVAIDEKKTADKKPKTLWGYIDRSGKFVIQPRFDYAGQFTGEMAVVSLEGKKGIIDKTGKFAVNPAFDNIHDFSEGLAAVFIASKSRTSMSAGKYGFIDKAGKMVIEPKWDSIEGFSEGLAPVGTVSAVKWTWRYIDKTGKIAFDKEFNKAKAFSDGLGAVEFGSVLKEKWSYIDKTGNFAIEPNFEGAKSFSNGIAEVKLNGKWIYIDKRGRQVKPPATKGKKEFFEGLAITTVRGKEWLAYWRSSQQAKRAAAAINSDLRLAAQKGNSRALEALLKRGADINARNERGSSALMLAAMNNR
ncbi:MAG: WG repeat-containing protein, partial [Deltaproteobacteria bacterium]